MSKPKLSTYAETQFGSYMGADYLKRFNYLRDKVSFEMTIYSASLYLNEFIGEDCNNKIKAYLHIHGYDPYFIFALCRSRFNKPYVSHNPLSSDLLMLKIIDQKMNKRELNQLHSWVVNLVFGGISHLTDKLKAEGDRLMKTYEGTLLHVAHKQPAPMPIVNTQNIKNNLLRVVC